jgi:cell division protein FtsA
VAGLHVTRDLSRCLETSMRDAEILKVRDGTADPLDVDPDLHCEVNGVGGRPPRIVEKKLVAEIIQPRLEEIFEMTLSSIVRSGYHEFLTSGIVLTGGSAMMPGVVDVATRIMGLPVRLGEPRGVTGLSDEIDDTSWATAVGLARGLPSGDLSQTLGLSLGARVMPQWLWRRWKEYF